MAKLHRGVYVSTYLDEEDFQVVKLLKNRLNKSEYAILKEAIREGLKVIKSREAVLAMTSWFLIYSLFLGTYTIASLLLFLATI